MGSLCVLSLYLICSVTPNTLYIRAVDTFMVKGSGVV
jgi:hypothetical protein